jgi:LysR family transcriptional regulator, regulator of abg operon
VDKALEQFVAVTEAGSFVAAAERLFVSQPALTYNLKKLEEKLGVKLFERSSRGVRLTPYGETLYKNALLMQRLYDNALETIGRQRAELEQGISIGTGYSTWILFLRDYIGEHFREFPDAPINVSIGNAMRCMDQLLAGDISLFVGHRIANLPDEIEVDFIPLGLATDGYYVRAGHPLLDEPRSMAEIFSWPTTMAFPPENRQKRLQAQETPPQMQPDRLGHVFTSNSLEACLEFIKATDAVLIHTDLLSGFFAEQGIEQVETLPDELVPRWLLGIYVLPERRDDPHMVRLIERIRDSAATDGLAPM